MANTRPSIIYLGNVGRQPARRDVYLVSTTDKRTAEAAVEDSLRQQYLDEPTDHIRVEATVQSEDHWVVRVDNSRGPSVVGRPA